ncbi:MAG: hypothetical protein IJS09_09315 [Treponema sp.]|nr:hypothetical protein [Treponema sp.]
MIGVAFLAGFLIVFNIIMWLVLLARFNTWFGKRFSTDSLVESVKEQINQIIKDMNRNTSRNVDLVDEHIQQLKQIIAKADRHLMAAKNELERQEQTQSFTQRLQSVRPTYTQNAPQRESVSESAPKQNNTRPTQTQRAADRYLRTASVPTDAYAVTEEGKRQIVTQGDLFDAAEEPLAPFLEPNTFNVSQDGASYASVPVIEPNVTYAEDPIVPKKDFSTQVRELYDRGNSVEQIASELGRSTTEVQFALDMGA